MTKGRRKPNVLPRQRVSSKASGEQKPSSARQVKLVRTLPEYVMTTYSDALIVQHKDAMFLLSYLQTQEPLIASKDEVSQIESVESRCVFRAAVTPFQMAQNIEAMEKNFAKFLTRSGIKAKDYKEFLRIIKAEGSTVEFAMDDEGEEIK